VPEKGYTTPEEAVIGGWRTGFATIVGSHIDGDEAHVWLLTNDRPPFEEYECVCIREGGLWRESHGWGGFSDLTPVEITEAAQAVRSRFA
jgi:hypothetical protein